jgi:DNA-binding SARP family transcriptional activator
MLLLIGALFFSSQRAALIEAQHNACFRLLGEALERQEFEKAKAAVQSYNNRDTSQHPTFQMIDVLTGKK